jgi:hypothetical protein
MDKPIAETANTRTKARTLASAICEEIVLPLSGFDGEAVDRLEGLLASALEGLGDKRLNDAVNALLTMDPSAAEFFPEEAGQP